ncbi:MAG: acyl-CoA dehydrogenase family protein [Gammaproteobacteria bacterium]|nr:acyl-CoA dehydrogenase family protein [Gammaproteobacteria bacterium]MDH3373302.1 acyl-CoA dehydrogenase family protein [Gammaproteobacteria bacterium]MDH3409467.1 acyl-CoA dehydrogenase family protein [Gammaproteobacteria bacterium]MDH3552158.1 acyl-CoA dehydrogenase family protein [Gammaproteobacteria bacterium]
MDFSFNEVQTMLSDSVEKFIANEYDFESRQKYSASALGYSAEVWMKFAELGWTAIPFSEDDDGFDGGPIESMVMMQQFGRGLVVEPYLANVVMAGGILRRVASKAQKMKWLHPIIAGELQAALALVEPQSRYELADVMTTAEADGDNWLINGQKGVVFNGGNAGLLIVPARTSGDRTSMDGITLFAVGGMADGVSRHRYPTVDGHQAAEIHLRNVSVGNDAVLGNVDDGLSTLEAVIGEATLAVCAEAVGIMRTMTDKTVEYSKNRVQFGVPIGSFQALQHRMVDMLTACEQSYSLLLWASMANADGTDEARRSISALKYHIGTAGQKVGQEAVQLHGGMGVSWDVDIAHYFKRLTAIGQMFGNADWHLDQLAD